MNTKVIFHCLGISQKNYFMNFVIPITILAILFPIIILLLVPSVMEGVLFLGVMLVPIALFAIVIIYPISSLEGKKKKLTITSIIILHTWAFLLLPR